MAGWPPRSRSSAPHLPWSWSSTTGPPPRGLRPPGRHPADAPITVPVVFRRSYPVEAFAAAIVIGGLQVLLNLRPNAADLAIVILLYTLAAYTPRRVSVTGLVLCLIGSATAVVRWMPDRLSLLDAVASGSILLAGPSLIAWVLGDSMRYRRGYYAALEDKAARLEAERRRPGQNRRRGRAGQDRQRTARRGRAPRQRDGGAGRRRPVRAAAPTRTAPSRARRHRRHRPAGADRDAAAAGRAAAGRATAPSRNSPRCPASASSASCSNRPGRRAWRSPSPSRARRSRCRTARRWPPTGSCRSH